MSYFIDPSWFYWVNVLNGVRGLLIGLLCPSIIGAICLEIGILIDKDMIREFPTISEQEKREIPIFKKLLILSIIVVIVSALALIFIPSKDTLIEMMIAKYITHENVETTVNTLKDVVDYITRTIQNLK